MGREIGAQDLVQLLARGEGVTVVDIRDAEDREWSIPGSLHVPVAEDLLEGRPGRLADLRVPPGRVVAVCWAGKTSRLAADVLAERGLDAVSLAGGMRAWSTAWDAVDVPVPGTAEVVQLRRLGKGCLSYLVAHGGEAVAVDPSLDPDVYLAACRARGWKLVAVADTHVHADHVSRGPLLARRAGAAYVLPKNRRSEVEHRAVGEGDSVALGGERLEVLAAPGHTEESVVYVLPGRALFTGDTLFPRAVGRPDLDATPDEARVRARALHGSLRRLLALDGGLLVLAAHADGALLPGKAPEAGTVAGARAALDVGAEADEFASRLVARLPPPPAHFEEVVAHNVRGTMPPEPAELEAGANRCAAR